jgi:hypothetical protein
MKRFNFNIALIAIVCFGLSCQISCSKTRPSDLPKLVSVTLNITQEGKPLSDAIVTLANADDQKGIYTASGTTDKNGVCVLYTHSHYKGSPLGKYKVRVSRTEIIPKPSARPKSAAEYEATIQRDRSDPPKTYQFVEEIYTDAKTTPLEIIIDGPINKTFDVGKAVKYVIKN